MSTGKRRFWSFLRREERRGKPFAEFLEQEKMPDSEDKQTDGQRSFDELFLDWNSNAASEEDRSRSARWDEERASEEREETASVPPEEDTVSPDPLVEFPPLLEEEELARLVRQGQIEADSSAPEVVEVDDEQSSEVIEGVAAAEVSSVPGEDGSLEASTALDGEQSLEVIEEAGGEAEADSSARGVVEVDDEQSLEVIEERPPALGRPLDEENVGLSQEVPEMRETLEEIYRLVVALEAQVAERLEKRRSDG